MIPCCNRDKLSVPDLAEMKLMYCGRRAFQPELCIQIFIERSTKWRPRKQTNMAVTDARALFKVIKTVSFLFKMIGSNF